jgi:ATP-dependent Clp protease ATP-binding subunit ClpC
MRRLNERLVDHDITVRCTAAGCELLVKEGFDPQFGARPLRRAIQRLIEDPLAEKMLQGDFKDGDLVLVDEREGEVVLRGPEPQDEPATELFGQQC